MIIKRKCILNKNNKINFYLLQKISQSLSISQICIKIVTILFYISYSHPQLFAPKIDLDFELSILEMLA